jgi:hypothetical protein
MVRALESSIQDGGAMGGEATRMLKRLVAKLFRSDCEDRGYTRRAHL